MKIRRQLKAFTILELTVAMLIAALVTGTSYTAYTLVSRSYKNYDEKNKNLSELLLADKIMKRDFAAANRITADDRAISINKPHGLVKYEFNEDYLIRNQYQTRADTFFISVSHLEISFENQACSSGQIADYLGFQTNVNGQIVNCGYSKQYSAAELMESE